MKQNIYENKSLIKLILIFGIPSILSLMMEMLTGIVDTIFAGNLPNIGNSALSAMALISPLLGVFTALQTLFAMSTGILIAKYLNNIDKRNKSYTIGVVMSVVVSVTTSVICYLTLSGILSLLGAKGEIFNLAKEYLQICLISNIFSSIGYTLTCCIRAFGFPKIEVVIISAAVVVNIIANFVFAFIFDMGIAGLSLGTLVSEGICMVASIIFLIKKNLWIDKIKISLASFCNIALELFKIGIAQTLIQILGGLTGFIINTRILALGSVVHIAALSIAQRIYTFILMPIVGLTQGVQSIISYFSGNNAKEKIKKVSNYTMILCGSYGIMALILAIFCGKNFIAVFGGNGDIIAVAQIILFIICLGVPFIGVLYTDMTLLQVTGYEFLSVLLILARQVLFLIPLIYAVPYLILNSSLNMSPIMSLYICMPIADVLSVIFAAILKKMIYMKIS